MKNKKDILVMLKEAGILFAITLLAGLLLGGIYEITKEPRRLQKEKAIQEACNAVFENATDLTGELTFETITYTVSEDLKADLAKDYVEIGTVFEAVMSGDVYGHVIEAISTKGYGGKIVLYVGVKNDGTVTGVSITEISETAGLGMLAPEVLTPQFAGKKVDSFAFTKNGATKENEVDAISSATITTRAVTNAVNGALKVVPTLGRDGGVANE